MSDSAVQMTADEKKVTKSDAIRNALLKLGEDAAASEIQKAAEKEYGGEIEIRTVYQIRSNIKTGRDKSAESQEKPVKPVRKAVAKNKSQKTIKLAVHSRQEEPKVHQDLAKLLELINLVKQFGGSNNVIELLRKVAV